MDNQYREDVRKVSKEAHWTFWRMLPVFVVIVLVLSIFFFALHSLGIIGETVIERKVFENSYQRQESLKSEIAINEETLIEIEGKLSNPNLDPDTRYNLEAQASAIRLRINTAKRSLK